MSRDTCDQCRYWHKGYLLQSMRVPSTCNFPGEMHSVRGDTLACKDFADASEARAALQMGGENHG